MVDKLTAELLPLGDEKYYGTQIQLRNGEWRLGNPLKVWYCGDSWGEGDGEDKPEPSEREKQHKFIDIGGGHYETKADLEVAQIVVDRINNHEKLVEALESLLNLTVLASECGVAVDLDSLSIKQAKQILEEVNK